MYSMACFLGLLSTVLLVLIENRRSPTDLSRSLFCFHTGRTRHACIFLGCLRHPSFVGLGQESARRLSSPPSLLRLQILVCIAASPLLAIAAYQSGAATRPTTLIPFEGVVRFLQFGSSSKLIRSLFQLGFSTRL